jgi:nucleoside-diphosphate-sugar epimerase
LNKRISVLGCGWLGKPLAESLVRAGFSVKGSTRSVSKLSTLPDEIEPFLLNINDIEPSIQDFLQSDIMIISITSKELSHFSRLLDEIEMSPVEKLIFISSSSVYRAENGIVTEDTDTDLQFNPLLSIERLFLNNKKIKTTIVRFAGLFGYDRKPGNFFRGEKMISDPLGSVNMIHRDDCLRLIHEIIRQEAWGEIFNGCAGTHPTKKEFYTKASQDIGLPPPSFSEHSESKFKIVSNNKIRESLGFTLRYNDLMALDFNEC